jgi:TonB family protein
VSHRWPEPRAGVRARGTRLGGAIGASAVAHALVIAGAIVFRGPAAPPAAPIYAVSLVAAPPGPRAIGVVDPRPPAATPQPTAPEEVAPSRPAAPEARPEAMKAPEKAKTPAKTPPRATPLPATTKKPTTPKPTTPKSSAKPTAAKPGTKPGAGSTAPRAGGGPEGGRGTDVANVNVAGLNFPYPTYLQGIVRAIALRFSPPRNSVLSADVAFLVHRDGSVSDIRVVRSSRNYAFDLEARGAVEAAGRARDFGPLPDGFRDDVLPVTFSFDPRLIR